MLIGPDMLMLLCVCESICGGCSVLCLFAVTAYLCLFHPGMERDRLFALFGATVC